MPPPAPSRHSADTYLVRKPNPTIERIDLNTGAVLGPAADILEQEDQGVDRLQGRECLGVERVEVVLWLALRAELSKRVRRIPQGRRHSWRER